MVLDVEQSNVKSTYVQSIYHNVYSHFDSGLNVHSLFLISYLGFPYKKTNKEIEISKNSWFLYLMIILAGAIGVKQ